MNLKEIIFGTPAEKQAKSNVKKLQSRINKGGHLSQSQQNSLETSRILAKRLTRRRLIAGTAATVGAVAIGYGTEELLKDSASDEKPRLEIGTFEEWRRLPAKDRLQSLW